MSIEDIENLEIDEYSKLLSTVGFILQMPTGKPKEQLCLENTCLYLIEDLNTITVGEFIDLENLFTTNHIKNLGPILSILYRQKTIGDEMFKDVIEPYGNYIFHRAPLFDDVKITDIFGVISKYLIFRTKIFENYQGLFEDSGEEEHEEVNLELIKDKKAYMEEEREKKITSKWGWDVVLLRLANNDPTKINLVTEMTLLQGLNVLSMRKELKIGEN